MMLRTAKRDVFEYGTTGLSKRAKRVVEAERKEAFGVKVKGEKMPLKMVRGIRRAEAKRMEKEKEERKVAGVVTARERRDRLTRKRTSKKRKRGIDDELKDGILRLN